MMSPLTRSAPASDRLSKRRGDVVVAGSLLPERTVGHVLTHVARNADADARRLAGALGGEDVLEYTGDQHQRCAEIDAGATRTAREIVADLQVSVGPVDEVFAQSSAAGWPTKNFRVGILRGR